MAQQKPPAPSEPILVVDDEPDTRYLLSSVLRHEGFQVETAVDGAEAVRAASAHRPALVLLDWRLPGENGAQVASAIRREHPNARFVVVTADGRAAAKAEQVQTGWYLQKPFQIDELMQTVTAALGAP
ncbi:MAG TPA: response regulator [Chloroflexota bacterium]|nr:response regulator [Chloroflexota bacterium]